jgi:hypothetical protein
VRDSLHTQDSEHAAMLSVAAQIGCSKVALCRWLRASEGQEGRRYSGNRSVMRQRFDNALDMELREPAQECSDEIDLIDQRMFELSVEIEEMKRLISNHQRSTELPAGLAKNINIIGTL